MSVTLEPVQTEIAEEAEPIAEPITEEIAEVENQSQKLKNQLQKLKRQFLRQFNRKNVAGPRRHQKKKWRRQQNQSRQKGQSE